MASLEDNKRIAKNTLVLYARMLLVMLVSLYTVRVVLNALGETDYGIYNVVGGIVVMFSFLSRVLASASQRYFAYELGRDNIERLKMVFNITLVLYVITIIFIILLSESIGIWFLHNKMTIPLERMDAAGWIFQFSIISFCFTLLMTPYQAVIIAHEKMDIYAFAGVFESLAYLCIAILVQFVITSDKLILYGFSMMVVAILSNGIYYVYGSRKYVETKIHFAWDSKLAKEITSYSGWNILGAIANIIRDQGINILINMFFSPAINAARGLAYQVSGSLNLFASNFYTAVRPQVTKKFAKGEVDETNDLVFSSSKLSFFLILFLAVSLILFIHPILALWLVDIPDYTEIFMVLVIFTVLADSLSNPLMTLVQATGKVKVYQLVVSFIMMLNLPISWIFLKIGFSAEYTMYTALGLSILLLFSRALILKYQINFPLGIYCKRILLNVIITTIICFIVSVPVKIFIYDKCQSLISLIISLIISVMLNIIAIIICGLNKNEKMYLKTIIKSKIRK